MNRYFIVLVLLVLLAGCHKTENEEYLLLSSDELSFDASGGAVIVNIDSNKDFYLDSEIPSWLRIIIKNDDLNAEKIVEVKADENIAVMERTAKIVFRTSGLRRELNIKQKGKDILEFKGRKEYEVSEDDTLLNIKINQTVMFDLIIPDSIRSWIGMKKDELLSWNNLYLEIAENKGKDTRYGCVMLRGRNISLSDTLRIIQRVSFESKQYFVDGEVIQLQNAHKANVNLVIMGDGFVGKDLMLGGTYETIMKQTMEYFFSIEPYTSYRDYFNVYMTVAESAEAGVSEKGSLKKVRNKFGTTYGQGTEITCDDDLCFEYVRKVKELPTDVPMIAIVVLNSTKYAGTTYLYTNGNSIALCPMSAEKSPYDFEGIIHHEAGGHGFGFLCDEYVYYERTMPEERKKEIKEWQKMGFQLNLDFTDDLSSVLWKNFIGQDKYMPVGAYEGGYEYQYGVWRSEDNSCMNNNIPYFNVQSRWSIVNRIMKLSGSSFTIQDFIESDHPVYPAKTSARSVNEFIPLGNPKWMK